MKSKYIFIVPVLIFGALVLQTNASARNGSDDSATTQPQTADQLKAEQEKIAESVKEAQQKAQEKLKEATQQAQERAKEAAKNQSEKSKTESKTDSSETETEKEVAPLLKITDKTEQQQKRKLSCESRASGIAQKVANLASNAQKHQDVYTSLLDKAIALKNDKGVSPTNFDTLVASAQTAKAESDISVSALKTLNVTIDCTSDNVATQIATIKAAGDQAKTDLKTYKTAVQAVLTSLEGSIQ